MELNFNRTWAVQPNPPPSASLSLIPPVAQLTVPFADSYASFLTELVIVDYEL